MATDEAFIFHLCISCGNTFFFFFFHFVPRSSSQVMVKYRGHIFQKKKKNKKNKKNHSYGVALRVSQTQLVHICN